MPAKIFYDQDADLALLKDKTLSILGYGSQGHAHAQNLRDSGLNVLVAELPGTPNHEQAVADGFQPVSAEEATKKGDMVTILLPDELQADVFRNHVRDHLSPGNIVVCSHGFNVHFGQFEVPQGVSTVLVAPKGPGHLVRSTYTQGGGVPSLIAVFQDSSGQAKDIALSYASANGGGRAGVIETSFKEETETDLFGEQAVLCGGATALVQAGFETLTEAGYAPEMAYFECLHELKLIVDLMYEGGIANMRYSISNTAEYGDLTRGPRIITEQTKVEMKRILDEIQRGEFAREFIMENQAGQATLKAKRRIGRAHQIEEVGARLRDMMPWIKANKIVDKSKN